MYSGVTRGRAKRGVAIIVAEVCANCIKSWRCVSKRCVRVRCTFIDDSDGLSKMSSMQNCRC